MSTKKIVVTLILGGVLSIAELMAQEYAVLQRISDGDTFVFRSAQLGEFRCRLFGIDTPEKFKGSKLEKDAKACNIGVEAMKRAGEASTRYAEDVLHVGKSYKVKTRGKDHHQRHICEVYTPHLKHDTYSKAIVADGYAVAFLKYITGFMKKREYSKLQAEAKRSGAGLWGQDARLMDCLAREAM